MTPVTLAQVESMLHGARLRLAEATGGAPLCRIGPDPGDGRLVIKRAEGAAAALADLRDALRRGMEPAEAIAVTSATWQELSRAHAERRSGPEWTAYADGGSAALSSVDSVSR